LGRRGGAKRGGGGGRPAGRRVILTRYPSGEQTESQFEPNDVAEVARLRLPVGRLAKCTLFQPFGAETLNTGGSLTKVQTWPILAEAHPRPNRKPVMRLAAVSVFFATFAATVWVIDPPPARTGLEPVGALPPTPEPPDWPPEPLDPEDIACMNGLANDPSWPREFRFLALRQLATHYLRPPADSARVAAVFRDRRWIAEAEITSPRGECWMGQPPPRGLDDFDQPIFWVRLLRAREGRGVWWMVRVSGLPDPSVNDFKAFLRGKPSPLRIEQSAWLWESGGYDNYTPKGIMHWSSGSWEEGPL
jgi:hypothetical protein